MNAALLVVVGVILLYFTITGKLDCMFSAWTACRNRDFKEDGAATAPAQINAPKKTMPTTADILKDVIA